MATLDLTLKKYKNTVPTILPFKSGKRKKILQRYQTEVTDNSDTSCIQTEWWGTS